MPTPTTKIPISFGQGLDTVTDPKQVIPGKLLELENGRFDKLGAISKRNGFDELDDSQENGTTITEGEAIAAFDDELLLFDGNAVYSRIQATDKWVDRGSAVSVITSSQQIVRNDSNEQSNPDGNINNGIEVYAFEDTRDGIRYSVIDSETKAIIVNDASVTITGSRPKVIAFQDALLIFYADSTSLKYRRIDIILPSTLNPEVELVADISEDMSNYDITVIGDRLFLAYNSDADSVNTLYLDSDYVASSPSTNDITASVSLGVASDASQNLYVATYDGYDVSCFCRSYADAEVFPPTTLETVSNVKRITGIETEAGLITWLYSVSAVNTYDYLIRKNTITDGYAVGTPSVFMRSVDLVSKLFEYNDSFYVNVVHDSRYQATYFTLDLEGNKIAKMNPTVAGGIRSKTLLSEVFEPETGIFKFANQIKGRVDSENGTLFSRLGISSSKLNFASSNKFISARLANTMLIVGGIVSSYDGAAVAEHNFLLYPENIEATPHTTDGYMDAGIYQYVVCYESTDNQGQIQRSTTSIPVSVTTTGSTGSVTLTIPTLRLTSKSSIRVVVYRSELNGELFYRVSSISAPLENDTSIDTVSFTDTLNDEDIISNSILYTTNGIIDDAAPQACSLMASHENRIFLAGLEDKNAIQYSKQVVTGQPVQFSDYFIIKVDAKGGDITALGSLDNKLVIFKKNSIYITAGNGFDAAGNGTDYARPQLVSSDVGCDNPNSVVLTPLGLMFKSNNGIQLLDRSLATVLIGDPVQAYNDEIISSATLVPKDCEVRFTTETGPTLVYSYKVNQWAIYTNHQAVDSDLWLGEFVHLTSGGKVRKENPDSFTDINQHIKLKIVTSWLSLAGFQGFQLFRRVILLGEYKGAHTLSVAVAYDFSDYDSQFATVDAEELLTGTTYGSGATYGSESYYGGQFTAYQFSVRSARPRCQSLRLTIEDNQSSDYNEGFSISGITLEVKIKSGTNRLPATRRAAAR